MTEHPKRLTMLQVDEATASVSSTTRKATASEMSESVDYDEIERLISGIFVRGLLQLRSCTSVAVPLLYVKRKIAPWPSK